MTCIAAIEHDGKVWMGGDSAGVAGYDMDVRSDEKVFKVGPFIMGFCGSFRMGQILRYALNAPEQTPSQDDMEYLVNDFVDHIRTLFKEKGFLKKTGEWSGDDEGGEEVGGTFMLGYRGKLYTIEEDFQVGRSACGYHAVGCGESIALGSLHMSDMLQAAIPPRERIENALEAAVRFSAGVRPPYTILSSD